ncbi:MAG: MBL fold metallo-hydrolase [Deltaproteobacteria bacterium]|nr:MBL fold metallo-hydrolase [Deltaproteobacteria bacterium]
MRDRAFVSEIAADTYRITTYHEPWRSTVNQYLILGEEPLLISTGLRERFEDTWAGLAQLLDPTTLRYVVVPHYEADECGALNELLLRAPNATPLASMRTVVTSLADAAVRSPRGLGDGEVVDVGAHGLRMLEAPYVHAWDGIVIVDERTQVAFTADLFIQPGRGEALVRDDRSALSVQLYKTFYGAPPDAYLHRALDRIEVAHPTMLAPGHGAALAGNLAPYYRAYRALAGEQRAAREATTPSSSLRKSAGS